MQFSEAFIKGSSATPSAVEVIPAWMLRAMAFEDATRQKVFGWQWLTNKIFLLPLSTKTKRYDK